ncbi:low molecular weight protein arginine phosphatase [Pallidibacillus thermolactis]|jgi:protein arginine phosphatase|uniref:low molecular weight protein arginine phosphatase n=1 Tax=Pallidibacillus thermolactis TaxID=251051 RepID=UPI0021D94A74|nr:low molecular weight protein arginine phosphatase [Pallidibacillus thermolactis]MCU9600236.1 low molecular weight protein arginine phosphatase [Pallidibacillus thermolactis subsp. kokeshiiformis]
MTRILFVCTGNTCRSPMAEAIVKSKNIPNIEVKSAGVFAAPGVDASPLAKQVLKENNISIQHQATQLQEETVDWADYILTMTNAHKQMIQQQFPTSKEKIYTLKEFALKSNGDVSDPFGGTLETYRETFNELQSMIDELLKHFSDRSECE